MHPCPPPPAAPSPSARSRGEDLEGITLHDLGEHKLKDLDRPERIYELQVDGLRSDFPPLKTEGEAARPIYRRRLVIGALAGAVAAAIVIPVLALDEGSGGGTLSALSGNSVGVVNPETGAIDAHRRQRRRDLGHERRHEQHLPHRQELARVTRHDPRWRRTNRDRLRRRRHLDR